MGRTNIQGVELIQGCESCELEAYPDPASDLYRACQARRISPMNGGYRRLPGWEGMDGGPWTIGWGDTGPDVVPGLVITAEEADERFVHRLEDEFEPGVEQLLAVEVTENQFSALVSFAYNAGLKNFAESRLLRKLNAGDVDGAAAEFGRWNKKRVKRTGRMVVLPGLTVRREAERKLFLSPGDGDSA